MNGVTTAFWSMTINNPDETTMALLAQGYPDYMRELIYTPEQGAEGTNHIQAWIKLQRQQRLSFVKKLFPRGHFKPITSAEYDLNTKRYAQKKDDTTRGASVHKFNDPYNTIENIIPRVCRRMYEDFTDCEDIDLARRAVEAEMVRLDYKFAKIFVSSTYKQMWKDYGNDMYHNLFAEFEKKAEAEAQEARVDIPTYTHTHTQPEKIISPKGYNNAQRDEDTESRSEGQDTAESSSQDGEDYDECTGSSDGDDYQGVGDGFGETDSGEWS